MDADARRPTPPPPMSAQDLSALIRQLQPEVVITHPVTDVHPGHRHPAEPVLAALPEAAQRQAAHSTAARPARAWYPRRCVASAGAGICDDRVQYPAQAAA